MSEALYRRYRPKGWDEVVGQEHVVETLRNAIVNERMGHAYLFAGPRGTGKTTLARILAKAANCLSEDRNGRPCNECEPCQAVNEGRFLDLLEMDAASNRRIDDIRELRDRIGFSPSQGRFKVYIIDEVHMLTPEAFNALLKTLEEPPAHSLFILATTDIHKIPATVLSRCQRHEFRRVPTDKIVANLSWIAEREGWQAERAALTLVARQATGSIRDAQSLLDQVASLGTGITLDAVQPLLGTATSQAVSEIIDALVAGDAGRGLGALHQTLDSGVDPRTLARQLTDYLRGLLLIQMGNGNELEATIEAREKMEVHAGALTAASVIKNVRAFNSAAVGTRGGWGPALELELALAEAFESKPTSTGAESERSGSGVTRAVSRGAGSAQPARSGDQRTDRLSEADRDEGTRGSSAASVRAEAREQHPPPSTPTTSPGGSASVVGTEVVDLTAIINSWKTIRNTLKRTHPAVDGLLNSCKPIEVRGDELVIGFQSEIVRELMDRPENMQAARDAIASIVGRPVRLRCVVINARGKVPPHVSQDGMVATALNQGGEIVDLQE